MSPPGHLPLLPRINPRLPLRLSPLSCLSLSPLLLLLLLLLLSPHSRGCQDMFRLGCLLLMIGVILIPFLLVHLLFFLCNALLPIDHYRRSLLRGLSCGLGLFCSLLPQVLCSQLVLLLLGSPHLLPCLLELLGKG